jgi:hypothetical protein
METKDEGPPWQLVVAQLAVYGTRRSLISQDSVTEIYTELD